MYHRRYLESSLQEAAAFFKVILVVGPRQVGKSTMLKNLFPHYPIVTFHPTDDVLDARKDPEFFLSQFKGPVILDEIQFAPELLAFIKLRVDDSDVRGQYFLTGSQNLSVLKTVSESLAGRVGIFELHPMVHEEILGMLNVSQGVDRPLHWLEQYVLDPIRLLEQFAGVREEQTLATAVWRGGFPGLLGSSERVCTRYFQGYVRTYIDRDVRTLDEVESLFKLEDFVSILAALTAQEINYSELGREIAVHGKTAQRWLGMVRSTYVWKDARAWQTNTLKRVVSKPKGYFVDTGLACERLRIMEPRQLLGHPHIGALFETYIANTVYALAETLPFSVGIYHWRSKGGAEVDLVLETGSALYPIEIKSSSSLSKHDARGLKAFREAYAQDHRRVMPGLIVYAGRACYRVDDDTIALPWNAFMRVGDGVS